MSQTPKSRLLLETQSTQAEEFAEHWAEELSWSLPRVHWLYRLGPHRHCRWDVLAACRYWQVSLMLTLTESLELSHCLGNFENCFFLLFVFFDFKFLFFFFSGRIYFVLNLSESFWTPFFRHTGTSSSITTVFEFRRSVWVILLHSFLLGASQTGFRILQIQGYSSRDANPSHSPLPYN